MKLVDRHVTDGYGGHVEVMTVRVDRWNSQFVFRYDVSIEDDILERNPWRFFIGADRIAGKLATDTRGNNPLTLMNDNYRTARNMIVDLRVWLMVLYREQHEWIMPFLEDADVELHSTFIRYLDQQGLFDDTDNQRRSNPWRARAVENGA